MQHCITTRLQPSFLINSYVSNGNDCNFLCHIGQLCMSPVFTSIILLHCFQPLPSPVISFPTCPVVTLGFLTPASPDFPEHLQRIPSLLALVHTVYSTCPLTVSVAISSLHSCALCSPVSNFVFSWSWLSLHLFCCLLSPCLLCMPLLTVCLLMNLRDQSKEALPSTRLLLSFAFGSSEPEHHIHILSSSNVFKNIA